MKIFPAIDLLGGKAVRLKKGDYNEVTVYSECPPEMAKKFKEAGAEWIHVVDLDGARDGSTANFATVETCYSQIILDGQHSRFCASGF